MEKTRCIQIKGEIAHLASLEEILGDKSLGYYL